MPKLTKRSVDSIPIPKTGETFVWDSQLAGFGLRVRSSGRKSYILQYRNAYGRSRRLTLGSTEVLTPHAARAEAVQLLASVKRGADPAEERKRARHGMTVAELLSHPHVGESDARLSVGHVHPGRAHGPAAAGVESLPLRRALQGQPPRAVLDASRAGPARRGHRRRRAASS